VRVIVHRSVLGDWVEVVVEEVVEPGPPCRRVIAIPAAKALRFEVNNVRVLLWQGRNIAVVKEVVACWYESEMPVHTLGIGSKATILK